MCTVYSVARDGLESREGSRRLRRNRAVPCQLQSREMSGAEMKRYIPSVITSTCEPAFSIDSLLILSSTPRTLGTQRLLNTPQHLPSVLTSIQIFIPVQLITMLFNLFIYLIGLFLAIQGAKSRVNVDPGSCSTPGLFNVYNAINEMVSMTSVAISRTSNAYNGLSTNEEAEVVDNTWDAYFGTNTDMDTVNNVLSKSSLPLK